MHLRSLVALCALGAAAPAAPTAPPDLVVPNDNRVAAGTMRGDTLALRLEARLAMWHPDGDDAPGTPMAAFAEEGEAARIPGPIVRVRAGTEVAVSVRNALADTLLVHGLHARAASAAAAPPAPPLVLAPGERREARFRLDAPGTFHYWGTTMRRGINFRTLGDAQLTGAIVVDDREGPVPADRVFVVGMWTDTVHRAETHRRRVLGVINGRSWPHTERLHAEVGDTLRWRVINASGDAHPMHLHGFHFRVDARGNGRVDTAYAPERRQLAVTEMMGSGATARITWVPQRPGNWLFHCHIPEHFSPRGPLGMELPANGGVHADHAKGGMNGLVMGIAVGPGRSGSAPPASAATMPERRMRLLVRANGGGTDGSPFYGYALHERGAEPPPDSGLRTGPALDLVRGQPVRIAVVNRLREPTAVHWHGIELDSYFDGVPGFSGEGRRVTPLIAPGDSFIVRFTPPRAGTFIYHTHADEIRQQLAGLAGVIVVREPGAPRDTATDTAILLSQSVASGTGTLVNGSASPPPLVMTAGRTHRLRLVQMGVGRSVMRIELRRDTTLLRWRPVAKDGADLPDADRTEAPGWVRLGIGETFDVEVTPDAPGEMRIEIRQGLVWPMPAPLKATLPVRVVAR